MNDILDKFRSKIEGAISNLTALQSEYSAIVSSVISNKIEYSFIKDDKRRDELELLSRQMNMHMHGVFTSNKKERFDNICRLAHKQLEGSLKYFFYRYYDGDLEKFKQEHKSGVERDKLSWDDIKPKSWRGVTFSQMYTVMNFLHRSATWYSLVKVFNEYRNTLSHFGYFEEIKEKEKDAKFKKFKEDMPVLVIVDLLEETLLIIQIKLEEKKS